MHGAAIRSGTASRTVIGPEAGRAGVGSAEAGPPAGRRAPRAPETGHQGPAADPLAAPRAPARTPGTAPRPLHRFPGRVTARCHAAARPEGRL
ncbi:hypothetical protein EAO69_16260 [Streptomyces sp. me109]|nr:hypothetical protein EAO69_16260 [Streptomyces sp. me109]